MFCWENLIPWSGKERDRSLPGKGRQGRGAGGPWRGWGGLFCGDGLWEGRHSIETSWRLHLSQPHYSRTQDAQLTVAGSSPWGHCGEKGWSKAFCDCFQSHLLFVQPSLLPAFLGSSSTPTSLPCVASCFMLWVFASWGLVGTARCFKPLIRSVNTHLQQHHSRLPQKLLA